MIWVDQDQFLLSRLMKINRDLCNRVHKCELVCNLLSPAYFGDWVTEICHFSPLKTKNSPQLRTVSLIFCVVFRCHYNIGQILVRVNLFFFFFFFFNLASFYGLYSSLHMLHVVQWEPASLWIQLFIYFLSISPVQLLW